MDIAKRHFCISISIIVILQFVAAEHKSESDYSPTDSDNSFENPREEDTEYDEYDNGEEDSKFSENDDDDNGEEDSEYSENEDDDPGEEDSEYSENEEDSKYPENEEDDSGGEDKGDDSDKDSCKDGFTVNAITKSNFIRKSLQDKGYSFPPNSSDVMKLVYKQYNVIKARVTNEISSKLNAGLRCSLTLDEFTSLKNRRYLNINVHFNEGEIFNLGMLRMSGSFSAENCVQAVETKLQEFGIITEKHLVACVTDGASMMVKFGKMMSCEYHLCYAHTVHLAVCDVLYNKQIDMVEHTVEVEDKSHEEDNGESEELVEDLDKALDLEFESGVGTDALFHVTYAEKKSITSINETIKKIKNVVKLFRKSPIKNEILEKYVKEEFGCEKMPVKIGLEKLCSRNATLLTAEGVFSFVIGELNGQNSEFAKNMKYSLIQRINERRNVNLIGLMQYLNFGRKYEAAAVTGDISRLPGKNCLVRQAQMIGTRLFCEEEESISKSSHSEEESIEILKEKPLTLEEKLEKAIYSKTKVLYCSTKKSTSFNKIMKQEMQLFDSTENPSPNIIKLCDALKTIPSTSVEAERSFSAAGLFVTKLRTRLSDKSINCLRFLKSYFKNE
ncbi:BED-type domain-containing protein [Trichonephila clavipes]|nr:BED-type domain-containing protein [Trichonephila clavipes]